MQHPCITCYADENKTSLGSSELDTNNGSHLSRLACSRATNSDRFQILGCSRPLRWHWRITKTTNTINPSGDRAESPQNSRFMYEKVLTMHGKQHILVHFRHIASWADPLLTQFVSHFGSRRASKRMTWDELDLAAINHHRSLLWISYPTFLRT